MVSGDVITVVQFTQVPEITRQGIAKHVNMICVTSARIRKWKVSSTGADKDKPFVRLNVLGGMLADKFIQGGRKRALVIVIIFIEI